MKYCSRCQITLPKAYAFCKSCGGPLVTPLAPSSVSTGTSCPSCGAELKSGWRFCKQCAYDIEAKPIPHTTSELCRNCGTPVDSGKRFCENCGKPAKVLEVSPERRAGDYGAAAVANMRTLAPELPSQVLSVSVECHECGTINPSLTDCQVCGAAVGVAPRLLQTSRPLKPSRRLQLSLGAAGAAALLAVVSLLVYFFWYTNRGIEKRLDAAIAQGNLVRPEGTSAYDYYHELKKNGADADLIARYEAQLVPMLMAQPQKMLDAFAVPVNKEPELSEWQAALRPMAWASEMKPNDNGLAARAKYIEGRVAYKNKQNDQALDLWRRASDLDRSWAIPPNSVGIIYNERKDWQTARQYLLEAIRRDSNWAVPYNNVGTSFFFERNHHQAWSYYLQAVERAPNWARPHAWLGDLAMRKKDYGVAVEEYQKVLELAHPDNTSLDLNEIRKRLDQAKSKSQQGAAQESLIQK